jgi:hypothetical protein
VGVVVVLMLFEVPLHPAIKRLNATMSAGPNKTPIRRKVGEIACIYNLQIRMLTGQPGSERRAATGAKTVRATTLEQR